MMRSVNAPSSPAFTQRVDGEGAALRTHDLTKVYESCVAVDHLNLEVRRGEIFGFLGPNGAGKTTTIRMALGLISPTEGRVEILGKDVWAHRPDVLPRVGALIESPALYPYLSGRGNLHAMAALTNTPEARIATVLEFVGLTDRADDRVRTYSLGMKQRLGIAIALLNDPDLLILDEPANSLDPAGIVEMRAMLRNLAALGKTIFLSSHVLAEVQQLCTRVAIVHHGKMITESTIDALVQGVGDFVVRVEQPEMALLALRQQAWGKTARLDPEGRILTPAPEGNARELAQFLVASGFAPMAMNAYEERLEDVFLRLTGATVKEDRA
ncbi:MAG TPA: ABC transporter ATP-binding protein [Ktedonobacterales bacterium]|nr:ABC transporter ATP-binding protein [Ktedonobacterales bacterium]